jgi:hypothetical protein
MTKLVLFSHFVIFFRDGDEVAVAYYRSGYGPDDFPSEDVSIQST